jgi:hypothetical protein
MAARGGLDQARFPWGDELVHRGDVGRHLRLHQPGPMARSGGTRILTQERRAQASAIGWSTGIVPSTT